jgi:hypothetical protein
VTSLAALTEKVLREQDENVQDEAKFHTLLDSEFGITLDDLNEAVHVDAGTAPDGEPIGPVFLLAPHAAFLAGLLVGKRFRQEG